MANFTLLSSPLQGFTDFRFRNAFHKHFGGIDTFFAPYIRLNGKMLIKPGYQEDLQLKNNATLNCIPQVMTNDADEFLFVVNYVQSLGYTELNWNLGCPYPMVVNRCMGSGLISEPAKIEAVLQRVHDETDITVSMKMRMGYEAPDEILKVMPMLNRFPLKNIAIHARIGKQLYEGGVDLDAFAHCLAASEHPVYYNGDITTVAIFHEMQERFPTVDHWMIGRGLISDPFLPSMMKSGETAYPLDRAERFADFHEDLFAAYEAKLINMPHVIKKMYSFWEYFAERIDDPKRGMRKVRKAKTMEDYDEGVELLLEGMARLPSPAASFGD